LRNEGGSTLAVCFLDATVSHVVAPALPTRTRPARECFILVPAGHRFIGVAVPAALSVWRTIAGMMRPPIITISSNM